MRPGGRAKKQSPAEAGLNVREARIGFAFPLLLGSALAPLARLALRVCHFGAREQGQYRIACEDRFDVSRCGGEIEPNVRLDIVDGGTLPHAVHVPQLELCSDVTAGGGSLQPIEGGFVILNDESSFTERHPDFVLRFRTAILGGALQPLFRFFSGRRYIIALCVRLDEWVRRRWKRFLARLRCPGDGLVGGYRQFGPGAGVRHSFEATPTDNSHCDCECDYSAEIIALATEYREAPLANAAAIR